MKSFTAQIVYRIECDGQHTDQYEEQWRLVFAENEEQAVIEARNSGLGEEATFIDRHGRTIYWRMLAVKDLQPVELVNGGLLFSMVREVQPVPAPIWAA
ncbi:MAG: DUF4288 domain-containing protein [Flavipsychrobacter sp.]|jgi:hypothetical protein|nr:DUF4288 domain-containing protein [Chitinophagaceae bacterium]MBL7691657.1 DUF4288 domain-containing protein [Flavipsychrobacter sp.]